MIQKVIYNNNEILTVLIASFSVHETFLHVGTTIPSKLLDYYIGVGVSSCSDCVTKLFETIANSRLHDAFSRITKYVWHIVFGV